MGCGSDDEDPNVGQGAGANAGQAAVKPRYPYPRAAISAFVEACAPTPGQRATCVCTIERLQRTLPYRDFEAADAAIRAGGEPEPRARRLFDTAAAACRDAR